MHRVRLRVIRRFGRSFVPLFAVASWCVAAAIPGAAAQSAAPTHAATPAHAAASAHATRAEAPAGPYASLAPLRCADASLACATSATPAWAPDGSLWVAWTAGGAVSVARSRDGGASFPDPIVLGRYGGYADTGPDARPQIAIDAGGRIAVVFDVFKDDAWNARVLASISEDGGASFSTPRPVTDHPASQRFPVAAWSADGALFVAWIDKRTVADAARRGRKMRGAALAYAWSRDAGRTFSESRLAHPASCECCRIGIALAGPRQPVLLFRAIFDGKVRDHAVIALDERGTPAPLQRVARDDWATDVCPHHGPALAIAPDGSYHAAWFTQGQRRSGTFYARSRDAGRSFSAPMRIGTAARRVSRPALLAHGARLWLAWKEFDGERTTVHASRSDDGGATWSEARQLAHTGGYSDHPLLIARAGQVHLSWQTRTEGYRLLPLEER